MASSAPSPHRKLRHRELFRFYSPFDGYGARVGGEKEDDTQFFHQPSYLKSTYRVRQHRQISFSYGFHLIVSAKGIENGSDSLRFSHNHNFQPIFSETYVNNVVPNRITVRHRWHIRCDIVPLRLYLFIYSERCQPIAKCIMPDISIVIQSTQIKVFD